MRPSAERSTMRAREFAQVGVGVVEAFGHGGNCYCGRSCAELRGQEVGTVKRSLPQVRP